ncbi:MAG: hypothetical protein KOO60_07445 [Gemmatimonadales bacterium]|nr:hypothetical protein [Gemmatimonadales bacterium]
MITEASKAIFDQYNATQALKIVLPGGMFFHQSPDSVTTPYCVYRMGGYDREEITGTAANAIVEVDWLFHVASDAVDGGEEIRDCIQAIEDAYNWQTLSVSGYNFISMQLMSVGPIMRVHEQWECVLYMTMKVEKE